MVIDIPSTGKLCTKCSEQDGNPLHDGICNVCYTNSLTPEEMKQEVEDIFNKTHGIEKPATKRQKDFFAICGFLVGIASIFLGMGLPPMIAIILSGIAINRTKEPKTGRWMAVTGLILGILYFIVYLYSFGYI